jgi:hypothetical protein
MENWGVLVKDGAIVESTGTGTINISGTGAPNGTRLNYGVGVFSSGIVRSLAGDITFTGVGGSGVNRDQWNHGIDIDSGGQVLSTGGARITLTGTGGEGTKENQGVRISDANTLISSNGGAIMLNGTGGAGTQEGNRGVVIEGGSKVTATGSAAVTIQGIGGLGSWGNHGVILSASNTEVSAVNGNITITGTGANSASGRNVGVWQFSQAVVRSTGSGQITVTGNAGNGGANGDNWGVMLEDANTKITSATGDISVTGIAAGTTDQNNIGLYVRNGAAIESTGSADIFLEGRGAQTAPGIATTGGANVIGGATATGNITLTASTAAGSDAITLSNLSLQSSGQLTLQPLAAATSVGLGGGAGTFNLSSTELATFQNGFSQIVIGRSDGTGAVAIGASSFMDPVAIYGGAMTLSGALNAGSNAVLLKSNGALTLGSGVTAGSATLVTSQSFVNNAGAAPFSLSGGRFLIYSVDPMQNTLGGLLFGFEEYGVSYPTPPGAAGNGLLYSTSNSIWTKVVDQMFNEFAESYDQFDRYKLGNQNQPAFFVGDVAIGYQPGASPDFNWAQNALLSFSSFNLLVEDQEHHP